MLKGICKEFITVKISENPLYEEAIFILKNSNPQKDKKDMLFEANRILCENGVKPLRRKRKKLIFILFSISFLFFGALLGFICAFLLQNTL